MVLAPRATWFATPSEEAESLAETHGTAPSFTPDTFWLATRRPCTPAPKTALLFSEVKLELATAVAMAMSLPRSQSQQLNSHTCKFPTPILPSLEPS